MVGSSLLREFLRLLLNDLFHTRCGLVCGTKIGIVRQSDIDVRSALHVFRKNAVSSREMTTAPLASLRSSSSEDTGATAAALTLASSA